MMPVFNVHPDAFVMPGNTAMQVDAIHGPEAWTKLRDNWNRVFDGDPQAQYFLSWEWLDKRLASGREQRLILAVKSSPQDCEYIAFFPLKMRTVQNDGGRFRQELMMAGCPASDYTGLLCLPGSEARAIPALAKALLERRWGLLWLHCFMASPERTRLLVDSFPAGDFDVEDYEHLKETEGHDNWICPYIELPEEWDAYLALVSANTRQKVRRFLRKVEGADDYRIRHGDAATAERDVDTLVGLWGRRWIDEEGQAGAAHQAGLKDILMGVQAAGQLFLATLWQGDRALGALSFIADRKTGAMLFYAAGRDLTFKDLPVGLVLHAHCIRYAIAEGFKTYEFLRGDEPYKFSFSTDQHRVRNIIVTTKTGNNWGGTLDPMAIPVALRMIQANARAGDLARAGQGCRQILEADPGHAGARALLAQLSQGQGRPPQAKPRFDVPSALAARPRRK